MKKWQTLCVCLAAFLCLILLISPNAAAETYGDYTYTVSGGKATITGFNTQTGGDIVVPDTLGGYPVTAIGNLAFAYNSKLTSLTVSSGITSIGTDVVYRCSSLTGIWVSEDNTAYTSDGKGVLYTKDMTTLLKAPEKLSGSYSVPAGVKVIFENAFRMCADVTSITLPQGVTEIQYSAFNGCNALVSLNIPSTVTVIGEWAFSCTSLTEILIPAAVTTIGDYAFTGSEALKTIQIPGSVTFIGGSAFHGCNNLTDIYFNGSESKWTQIVNEHYSFLLPEGATVHFSDGWQLENGTWYYYENGAKVKNAWRKDTAGWCYLGKDGAMVKNTWQKDSKDWCYLNAQGYMATNAWVKDSAGWCYLGADGYMVRNSWQKDSKGWCYIDSYGYWLQNGWAKDSIGWCYLENGYMIYSVWKQDSKGWCYINAQGYMAENAWARDSQGWYWMDGNGYISKAASLRIGGKTYYFNTSSGLCLNP